MTVYIVGLTLAVLSSVVTGKSPCCTVPKWEAILGFINERVVSGQGVVDEGRALLSYDRDNQMINLVSDEHQGGKHSKGRYLYDFKNKMQYIIDEQEKCQSNPFNLTEPMESGCVPDGAKKVANYYYGSSDSPLNVDVYRLAIKGQNVHLTVAPTGTTCIPIAVAFAANHQPLNYGFFSNFTVGIENTTVFGIPPQCKKIPFPLPIKNKIPKQKLGRYVK